MQIDLLFAYNSESNLLHLKNCRAQKIGFSSILKTEKRCAWSINSFYKYKNECQNEMDVIRDLFVNNNL